MIKHIPNLNTEKVCKFYSEKDGTSIKYVCTTALDDGVVSMDIFYRDTPHPTFGNRYFGLFANPRQHPEQSDVTLMICNADKVEQLKFGLVEDDDGNLQYSAHRWDYKSFVNGNMIDGGRAYTKWSGRVKDYVICNGDMIQSNE